MRTSRPRASVVMTVYRDFRFFDEAVESVLRQDFEDLELVIVDDGNADKSALARVQGRDPRIRLLVNSTNIGTAAAANRGIAESSGEIIVRLDADDAAEPARISQLIAALDAEPDLGLVGSAVHLVHEDGSFARSQQMPETDADIRWTILFHNPFYHSAVAYRRTCFDAAGGYLEHEFVSQDHYLWSSMLDHCRARNLAEPLVRYRVNSQGLTVLNSAVKPRARTHAIRQRRWAHIGLEYDLYDDVLAGDISEFLRGHDLAPSKRRRAYAQLNRVMDAYMTSSGDDVAGRLAVRDALIARMASNPANEDETLGH